MIGLSCLPLLELRNLFDVLYWQLTVLMNLTLFGFINFGFFKLFFISLFVNMKLNLIYESFYPFSCDLNFNIFYVENTAHVSHLGH